MIQLSNKETPRTFVFLKTSFSLSYLTFAKGGYIISIKPIAKGILVVPEENELIKEDDEGIKKPMATPTAIAINIQSVKYLSKKLNFFLSSAGAQLFADIIILLLICGYSSLHTISDEVLTGFFKSVLSRSILKKNNEKTTYTARAIMVKTVA